MRKSIYGLLGILPMLAMALLIGLNIAAGGEPSQEPPMALAAATLFTVASWFTAVAAFAIDLSRRDGVSNDEKVFWALSIVMLGFMTMPLYWRAYIVADGNPGFSSGYVFRRHERGLVGVLSVLPPLSFLGMFAVLILLVVSVSTNSEMLAVLAVTGIGIAIPLALFLPLMMFVYYVRFLHITDSVKDGTKVLYLLGLVFGQMLSPPVLWWMLVRQGTPAAASNPSHQ